MHRGDYIISFWPRFVYAGSDPSQILFKFRTNKLNRNRIIIKIHYDRLVFVKIKKNMICLINFVRNANHNNSCINALGDCWSFQPLWESRRYMLFVQLYNMQSVCIIPPFFQKLIFVFITISFKLIIDPCWANDS